MRDQGVRARSADPAASEVQLLAQFVETQKYATVPERRGLEPALFRDLRRPDQLQGLRRMRRGVRAPRTQRIADGHKEPATPDAPSTVDDYRASFSFFRTLPPTPAEYRNDKALADLMLGENALGYVGGAGSCSGCGEATALRMLVAATRQVYGPESMGIVAATGCNTVYGSTYPYNPYLVPWTNSLFENAAADALGIRARWDQAGHPDRRLWAIGGDGAMYDIGFQALSRLVASGADIKVMVLDTQAYSNTGGQASTASLRRPGDQAVRFRQAHPWQARTAQGAWPHPDGAWRRVRRPDNDCPPQPLLSRRHGRQRIPRPGSGRRLYALPARARDRRTTPSSAHGRLAVDSRAFPLFTYDPRRGPTLANACRCRAIPRSAKTGIEDLPDGSTYDFVDFARSEGRFAHHFAPIGGSEEITATPRTAWRTGECCRRWPECSSGRQTELWQ